MNVVTDAEILEILGSVEPSIVAAIRKMAATRDELEEATTEGEPFENLDDARIDELREILARRGLVPAASRAARRADHRRSHD